MKHTSPIASRASVRSGFTLVELLVVITIIGMLMALLLPAVQNAREAARVSQCNNNLAQIARACLGLEAQVGTFPSAGVIWNWQGDPDVGTGYAQPGGWTFSILPYMEQMATFMLASDGKPEEITDQQKQGAAICYRTLVPTYSCVTRRPCKLRSITSYGNLNANHPDNDMGMRGDYGGNYGAPTSHRGPSCYADVGDKYTWSNLRSRFRKNNWTPADNSGVNGIIYDCSRVKSDDIFDGNGNTYLVGERYVHTSYYENGTWGSDNEGVFCGMDQDNVRSAGYIGQTASNGVPTLGDDNPILPKQDTNSDNDIPFGSAHTGSWGMSMCDGSVHRLSYSIDGHVHLQLAARNDGVPTSVPVK